MKDVTEMIGIKGFLDKQSNVAPVLLRVGLAIVFVYAGYTKLTGLEGTTMMFTILGIPAAGFMALFVGLVEVIGGLLLVINLQTRLVALFLSGVLVVALLTMGIPVISGKMEGIMPIFSVKDIALLGGTLALVFGLGDKKSEIP